MSENSFRILLVRPSCSRPFSNITGVGGTSASPCCEQMPVFAHRATCTHEPCFDSRDSDFKLSFAGMVLWNAAHPFSVQLLSKKRLNPRIALELPPAQIHPVTARPSCPRSLSLSPAFTPTVQRCTLVDEHRIPGWHT